MNVRFQAPERRERLQQIMALLVASGAVSDAQSVLTHRDQKSHAAAVAEEREKLRTLMDMDAPATSAAVSAPPTMVFSEGSPQLHEARVFLAQYSLPRCVCFASACRRIHRFFGGGIEHRRKEK